MSRMPGPLVDRLLSLHILYIKSSISLINKSLLPSKRVISMDEGSSIYQ